MILFDTEEKLSVDLTRFTPAVQAYIHGLIDSVERNCFAVCVYSFFVPFSMNS